MNGVKGRIKRGPKAIWSEMITVETSKKAHFMIVGNRSRK